MMGSIVLAIVLIGIGIAFYYGFSELTTIRH